MRASEPTHLAGHVMWTRAGTAWATWRISPLKYGFRSAKDKEEARQLHQRLFRSLKGEALLLGVCASLDPEAVVARMIRGVDLERHGAWAEECWATLDTLEGIGIGQRAHWLAVPLTEGTATEAVRQASRAAWINFKDHLGVGRAGLGEEEIARRMHQAGRIEASIPWQFKATRSTPAQMVWLHQHAQQRGLWADASVPEPGSVSEELLTPQTGAALPAAWLDEGGQSDRSKANPMSWNPLEHRYVKVTDPGALEPTPSYQTLLVLADVPAGGLRHPGCEFLGRIDESGLEVDWAAWLNVRAPEKIAKKNQRALIRLNEQYKQRDGELSTGVNVLDRAADELTEYAAVLESDKNEVEVQNTIMMAVSGPTPESAKDQAAELVRHFASFECRLQIPTGAQDELWNSMIPGTPRSRVVREYTQIATSKGLSMTVPFASSELGDETGPVFALNQTTGRAGVVHLSPAAAAVRNRSGSIALVGEKGAGKSLAMKTIAGYILDRGGRVIAVDRSPMGEWAQWAEAVTNARVASTTDPTYSLDPLRLFGDVTDPDQAAEVTRAAQNFLTVLLDLDSTSDEGGVLSDILDPAYLSRHELTSLGGVLEHLMTDCAFEGADALARRINVFARKDIGRVVFDEALPVLDRRAPGIVIRTHGLELPSNRELTNEHLFRQMSIEKRMGRALYALIGALSRRICFEDNTVFATYFLDECHHQTRSPEGLEELILFARDDRKHNAAMILGTHDPSADLGDETMQGLIPTRIVLRQTDETLARRSLKWIGMDHDDEDLIDLLMHQTSPETGSNDSIEVGREGEGFLRDRLGRIGRIKILPPNLASRNAAVRTTPEDPRDAEDGFYEAYEHATVAVPEETL